MAATAVASARFSQLPPAIDQIPGCGVGEAPPADAHTGDDSLAILLFCPQRSVAVLLHYQINYPPLCCNSLRLCRLHHLAVPVVAAVRRCGGTVVWRGRDRQWGLQEVAASAIISVDPVPGNGSRHAQPPACPGPQQRPSPRHSEADVQTLSSRASPGSWVPGSSRGGTRR